MEKPLNNQARDLVFNYDLNILIEIVDVLKKYKYKKIQYIPPLHSYLAVAKEHENIFNLLSKKKHLLFYYSLFPKIYRFYLSKHQRVCFDACFSNQYVSKAELQKIFPENLIKKAVENNIVIEKENNLKFTLSFLPFDDYVFLREPDQEYDDFYVDPEKTGHPEFDNRVWVGADSIIFARFLKKYLKEKHYNRAIEIGSGTGILTIICSKFTKSFEAIDYNNRAVQYTKLNVAINKIPNVETRYSNLFENVEGKFDFMLAAPWFVDLEKGGLEEVPDIMNGLDKYLKDDGLCLMTINSYVKNGKDPNIEYLKNFIKSNNYDLELFTMGYQIERERIKDWKKNNIDYVVGYFAIIKKDGKGTLKRHEVSFFRKLRDFTFIRFYWLFSKYFNFFNA